LSGARETRYAEFFDIRGSGRGRIDLSFLEAPPEVELLKYVVHHGARILGEYGGWK